MTTNERQAAIAYMVAAVMRTHDPADVAILADLLSEAGHHE